MSEQIDHVEHYRDENGEYRWRARARNGEIVAESGEGYKDSEHCKEQIAALFPDTRVEMWDDSK